MLGNTYLLAGAIVFASSLTQSLTGFGFALLAVPLLLYILPSQEAVLVSMVLATVSLLLNGVNTYRKARWHLILKLLLISLPGLILGVIYSSSLNPLTIKGVVGFVLIVYVLWQWPMMRKSSAQNQIIEARNDTLFENRNLQIHPLLLYSSGFLSGVLNGLAAIPGPPVIALFVKYLRKDDFHATIVNFFILQYIITLGAYLILQKEVLSTSLTQLMMIMLLPVLLGNFIGRPIRKRINEKAFKNLVFLLLFLIGISSAWEPLKLIFTSQ